MYSMATLAKKGLVLMALVREKRANNKYRHHLIPPYTGPSTDNLGRNRNTYDMRRTPWREPPTSQYAFWARNQSGQVFWRYVDGSADLQRADRIIAQHFLRCNYRRTDEGLAIRDQRLSPDENLIFYVGSREDDNE